MQSALVVFLGLTSSPALAARAPDLAVAIDAPTGVTVYEEARWHVDVANIGNRHATDVTVTIDLPVTHTSPIVYVMGELGALHSACVVADLQIICQLNRIKVGHTKTLWFDVTLPAAAEDLVVAAMADVAGEADGSDNADSEVAALQSVDVVFSAPLPLHIEHCTGRDLTSFYECEISPGSVSSHDITLNANGSLALPPGYTGNWWSQGTDHLALEYRDATSAVVMSFEGFGVTTDCWEGPATFADPQWVAMYRVCR